MYQLLWEAAFIAAFGLALEVVFTAIVGKSQIGPKKHLMGYSSIWYIPMYAAAPYILHQVLQLAPGFFSWHWVLRGLVYTATVYLLECACMYALRLLLGSSPSEKSYYASGRSFRGLVRWDFIPAWFVGGLLLEQTHAALHGFAPWHCG